MGTGLILIANGALTIASHLADFTTIVTLIAVGSLWWLAGIEVEELNRQGVKPDVGEF